MEALAGRDVGEGFHFGNVVIGICRSSRGGGLLFLNRIILEMRHKREKTGQKAHFAASDHFDDHE